MKTEDIQNLVQALKELDKHTQDKGPQTDAELHEWIKNHLYIDIARVAVCDGHHAPFDFLADIYFERQTAAIAMAARGTGKTALSAIIHLLNSLYKPGSEGMTVGAIEAQALRAYDNFKKFLVLHGRVDLAAEHPMILNQIQRETTFKNKSKIEIVPGTMSAVNGPHSQKVHTDEVELMDVEVFMESRNISQSRVITDKDGNKTMIKAQDWITSTRKRAHGLMQSILDSITEAKNQGTKPPYELYIWCVFEAAENVPNCQITNPDLGTNQRCICDKVTKGTWDDGVPRRFSDVCRGRLSRSSGFIPLEDLHKKFQESNQETWEAQQECLKPETGGLVFPTFTRQRYGVKWYEPDPQYGPIYMGVDFGGVNPHAVSWYQVLRYDRPVYSIDQERSEEPAKILKEGTRVCFDEVYISNISNVQLADLVRAKEQAYKKQYKDFSVRYRFADPAAASARMEFAVQKMPTVFFCTRDIISQVKTVNDLLKDDMFAVDITQVEMLPLEMEAYSYPQKKMGVINDPEKPIDDFNHQVSAARYTLEHLKFLEGGGEKRGFSVPVAGNKSHKTANASKSSAPRYLPR